ncbi:MAG: methyl-accepting chemotaxis protein [Candidatus Sulfotelmatobacter sp.]|jgi:methyl-accepting chemotaxis protein
MQIRLTVGRKLGLSFGVILAFMVASTVVTYVQSEQVKRAEDLLLQVRVPTLTASLKLQRDMNQAASKARQAVLAADSLSRKAKAQKLLDTAWIDINQDLDQLDELSTRWSTPANLDRLADIHRLIPAYQKIQAEIVQGTSNGTPKAALAAGAEMEEKTLVVNDQIKKALGEMGDSAVLLLQQNQASLDAESRGLRINSIVLALVALAVGTFLAAFMSRRISRATQCVLAQTEAIAGGDLTRDDLEVVSEDELGDLTKAINRMHTNLKHIILAIADNAQQVAMASSQMSATSHRITANSEQTSTQANAVSQATQLVSQNLQSVSTGAGEMSTTIQDIASNAHAAAAVASNAVATAQAANVAVGKLGQSSAEIGEVIKVITSIAQQTNLLALNATIEAARAGEAGKGFAVVANEVKELAKQTSKATEDISRKITAIQTDTKGAVGAIGSISDVIRQVSDISGTIATAVEEQSATTNEMTRNVGDAAKGSEEITRNIEGVAQAARGTSTGAQELQKSGNELAEMAAQLRTLVERFKIESPSSGEQPGPTQRLRHLAARAGA